MIVAMFLAGVLVFLTMIGELLYLSGYHGGQDGSTLDGAGTVALVTLGAVGVILCTGFGYWLRDRH